MNTDRFIAELAGEGPEDLGQDERAALEDLRASLADEAVWVEPPPGLEDAVVSAITSLAPGDASTRADDEAGTRLDSTWLPESAAEIQGAPGAPIPLRRRSPLRARTALGVLGAAAAVLVALVLVISRGGSDGEIAFDVEGTELAPDAEGRAVMTRTDSGWRFDLDATGLERLDNGRFYQAWLRSDDGTLVSIGTFNEGTDVILWAGVSPRDFPTFTVTAEEADGNPASSGRRVLAGQIEL